MGFGKENNPFDISESHAFVHLFVCSNHLTISRCSLKRLWYSDEIFESNQVRFNIKLRIICLVGIGFCRIIVP